MTIDISFFGFIRFYFAVACPWQATAIGRDGGTGWEYCSLHVSAPSGPNPWYLGWAWDTDLVSLMLGPWKWENCKGW